MKALAAALINACNKAGKPVIRRAKTVKRQSTATVKQPAQRAGSMVTIGSIWKHDLEPI
jgi:hypothetical protein